MLNRRRIRWFCFFVGFWSFMIGVSLLFLTGPTPAEENRIKISTEAGVPEEAVATARRACDAALRFFREAFNLELRSDVRIHIVPTPETYAAAFLREAKISQKEADRRARTTFGWSIGENLILQNVGAPFNPNARRRIYNIGHEIVHKFQGQECADQCAKILWLYEGAAGAFAARVVELAGDRPLAQQKLSWLEEVRKLPKRPELREMASQSDWYKALDRYGSDPAYSLTALAVAKLIEDKGSAAIFGYFRNLKAGSLDDAFRKAFGLDLKAFENEFNAALDRLLTKTGA